MRAFRANLGRAASAALFLFLPVLAAAQDAARPALSVGDEWRYRMMDYWTNSPTGLRDLKVTAVTEKALVVVVTTAKGAEIDEIYTPEWNAVATARGNYSPETGLLRFPLRPGTSYPVAFEMTFGPQRNWRARHEHTARVVGWEDITVQAGKFRALKVETEGSFQRLDTSVAGSARFTIWYVPELKRWAKLSYEDTIMSGFKPGPNNKFGEELVFYRPQ